MASSTLVFAPPRTERRASPLFARRVLRTLSGAVGAALLTVLVLAAAGAPWVTPYDPAAQDLGATARPPSLSPVRGHVHLLGTDQLGRDILSRLLVGLRISLLVALV